MWRQTRPRNTLLDFDDPLRYEGRYNNAAAPIGPFIRTLDDTLSVNDLKGMNIDITAQADDGFTLSGTNSMGLICRDIEDPSRQPSDATTRTPTGWCSSLARCSLSPRIAMPRGRLHPQSGGPHRDLLPRTRHTCQQRQPQRHGRTVDIRCWSSHAKPDATRTTQHIAFATHNPRHAQAWRSSSMISAIPSTQASKRWLPFSALARSGAPMTPEFDKS